jgi:hypothetical protein
MMTDRQRADLASFRARIDVDEREQAERLAAPLNKAHAALHAMAAEIDTDEKERLLGNQPDLAIFVDQYSYDLHGERDSIIQDHNARVIEAFKQRNPSVYWGSELVELIGNYFDKHHIRVVGLDMLEHLVERLRQANLLPAPPPEPEPVPAPAPRPRQMTVSAAPKPMLGRDQVTGEERTFSEYEIARMSADTYRRTFRLRPEVWDPRLRP